MFYVILYIDIVYSSILSLEKLIKVGHREINEIIKRWEL